MKESRKKNLFYPFIFFIFLSCGIIVSAILFLKQQERSILETQKNDLMMVAKNKAEQIENWKRERITDGELITLSYMVNSIIDRFLKNPADKRAKSAVQKRLLAYIELKEYREVLLLDAKGEVVLSEPNSIEKLNQHTNTLFFSVMKNKQTMISDLIICETDKETHIDVIAPVFLDPVKKDIPIGALIFRTSPNDFIYPLLEEWPIVTNTAEAILVKKEKDSVLYLSNLRHRKNAAMNFSLPLENSELPASKAIKGFRGFIVGSDYRGEKVLATVVPVKDSPWYVKAKIDYSEAMAIYRIRSLFVLIIVCTLILALGAIVGWGVTRIQRHYVSQQYNLEIEKQALLKHFEYLVKHANDVIILNDSQGNIIEVNGKAEQVYGYTYSELLSMNIQQIVEPETYKLLTTKVTEMDIETGIIYESKHVTKRGKIIPVEVSTHYIYIQDKKYQQRIIRDITERKISEMHILRQNRLYSVLSNINKMIVRVKDLETMYNEACRIAVEEGKFLFACISSWDDQKNLFTPVAKYGSLPFKGENLYGHLKKVISELPYNLQAIKSKEFQVINDVEADLALTKWQKKNDLRDVSSLAAFPISFRQEMFGVFTIFSNEKHFFHHDFINLFGELVLDISFGMEFLDNVRKLEESEANLKAFFNSGKEIYMMFDTDYCLLAYNMLADSYINRMYGKKLYQGMSIIEMLTPQIFESTKSSLDRALGGDFFEVERNVKYPDNTYQYLLYRYSPVFINEMIQGVTVSISDVTEKKEAAIGLEKTKNQLQTVFNNSPLAFIVIDVDNKVQLWNKAAENIFGWTEREILGKDYPLIPADKMDEFNEIKKEILGGKKYLGYQTSRQNKQGKNVQVSISTVKLKDFLGQRDNFLAIIEDISERYKIQKALIENEEKYRTLFMAATDGIAILKDSIFVDCNENTLSIYGGNREQIIGLSPFDVSPEYQPDGMNSQEKGLEYIKNSLKGVTQNFEWLHKKLDGTLVYTEISLNKIVINEEVFVQAIIRDISLKKEAELLEKKHLEELEILSDAALKLNNLKNNKSIQKYIADIVYDLSKSMTIISSIDFERNFLTITEVRGFTDSALNEIKSIVGFNLADYSIPVSEIRTDINPHHVGCFEEIPDKVYTLLYNKIPKQVCELLETKLFIKKVFGMNLFIEDELSGSVMVLLTDDISLPYVNVLETIINASAIALTRCHADEMLHRLNLDLENRIMMRTEQLQVSNQELESFSYSVSHDLRSPLRTIEGFSQAILEDCAESLDQKAKEYLIRMKNASVNMAQLIDDLLNLSRITRRQINVDKVNLSEIITTVLEEIKTANPQRDIRLLIKSSQYVTGDSSLIRIAVQNIIDNAIKFSSKKDYSEIEFGVLDLNDKRTYFIRDNGEGFNMKYVDKLFSPFQRLHRADEYPGTGIGLSIVKRIINRHGGKVWIESESGIGTTLFFTL